MVSGEGSSIEPGLQRMVEDWQAQDPDAETRAELQALIDAGDERGLRRRFAGHLSFGTAGLRAELGAGPTRMNRVVVARAAAGLASYLRDTVTSPSVVIGYDARRQSARFALDSAELIGAAGVAVRLLPQALPTPVLAFAVRHLKCSAGVMVTASHNPPGDNGYKVYAGDGAQIAAPVDAAIAAAIDQIGRVDTLARSDSYEVLDDSLLQAYVDVTARLVSVSAGDPPSLRIVHTSLHGVGAPVVRRVFATAGLPPPVEVAQQADPDPDFSTVDFPNPEEPGVLDLSFALAERVDADLVVANDPDADRCGVAVPGPDGWQMLRGDEVGVLLADDLLRRAATGTFATTIVSSSLLAALCAEHGVPYVQTLTGFKWLCRVPGLTFAYEEALGYCVAPDIVRDKDGISAALAIVDLATRLNSRGSSLRERLDEIAARHGLFSTGQVSVRTGDHAAIDDAMRALRSDPPARLGGHHVTSVHDLAAGAEGLPPTDAVRLVLDPPGRVVVRPSGTEAKIKAYLEVIEPVDRGDVASARPRADRRLRALTATVMTRLTS